MFDYQDQDRISGLLLKKEEQNCIEQKAPLSNIGMVDPESLFPI